jgi:hypothetical protein
MTSGTPGAPEALMRNASLLFVLSFVASALVAVDAAAEPTPDQPSPEDDAASRAIDRTWAYLDDSRVAAPLRVVAMTSATYTNVGSDPSRVYSPYRAFGANTAQAGTMLTLGGEVGLLPHVSVLALGQMGFADGGPGAGALAGVRVQLLPSSMQSTHLVLSAGYVREAYAAPTYDDDAGAWRPAPNHGDDGAWAQVAFVQDVQRLRLGTTVHAEHVFADGRDPVDVMVQIGASYRVVGGLRAGVEYVGQDLEEAMQSGAEAGTRHFVGPTASLQLLRDRLTIVAGPALGLSQYSPTFVGRLGMAYGF